MKKSILTTAAILMLLMSGCASNPADLDANNDQLSQIAHDTNASWTRVDRQTDWPEDYNFPALSFEYPTGWEFRCCGDMDHASQHLICADEACDKTYIKITDYALSGCPSGKWDCSIDLVVPKTAQQKYDELKNEIQSYPGTQVLGENPIPGLNVDALLHAKADQNRPYLINLGDDVIEVEFSSASFVDGDFIHQFFSRMAWDRE